MRRALRGLAVLGLLVALASVLRSHGVPSLASWTPSLAVTAAAREAASAQDETRVEAVNADAAKTGASVDAAKTETAKTGAAAATTDAGPGLMARVRQYAVAILTYPLTIALGIFILSYVLARWFSRSLRMPDFTWKIGLVAFTVIASAYISWVGISNAIYRARTHQTPPGSELKFGIDLRGGVNLVYQIKSETGARGEDTVSVKARIDRLRQHLDDISAGKHVQDERGPDLGALIDALRKRIDPAGQKQIIVRPSGSDQVEIIVPDVTQDEVAEIKKSVIALGTLEFRILAHRLKHLPEAKAALALEGATKEVKLDPEDADSRVQARWVPLDPDLTGIDGYYSPLKDSDGANVGNGFFTRALQGNKVAPKNTPLSVMMEPRPDGGMKYKDGYRAEILVVEDAYNVKGDYLSGVSASIDPKDGTPAVSFTFDSEGASRFTQLTTDFRPPEPNKRDSFRWHLAVVLNGYVSSAPTLNDVIGAQGQISGYRAGERGTKDRDRVLAVLRAGQLPAQLYDEPLSENRQDAALGMDTIMKSVWSMVAALALLFVFMLVYYRFSGFVACIALLLNTLLLVAAMVTIGAALTLPGFAGMVLTVGMAVDSNVLIYERMREELERGASLRMAIRNGFDKALSAIVDSNITTIITAIILFYIGTEQLKGFAVTLILGLTISMYTAVFCSRLIFDIAERRRWLTEIHMLKFFGKTNYDFLRVKWMALGFSWVIIIAGMVAVYARGRGLLDIDFTGGIKAQAVVKEGAFDKDEKDKRDTMVGEIRRSLRAWNDSIERANDAASLQQALKASGDSTKLVRTLEAELLQRLVKDEERLLKAGGRSGLSAQQIDEFRARLDRIEASSKRLGNFEEFYGSLNEQERQQLRELARLDDLTATVTTVKITDEDGNPIDQRRPYVNTSNTSSAAVEGILEIVFGDKLDSNHLQKGYPKFVGTSKTVDKSPPAEDAKSPEAKAPDAKTSAEKSKTQPETTAAIFEIAFRDTINHDSLLAAVGRAARAQTPPLSDVVIAAITASNPAHDPAVAKGFDTWTVTINAPQQQAEAVLKQAGALIESQPLFPASNSFGSLVSAKMSRDAIVAIVASWLAMLVYLWIRFQKVAFGLGAVVALVHDSLVALSFMAFSYWLTWIPTIDPFKINLDVVAAFLTLIGYSVNDTIVIFDRVREIKGKSPDLTPEMVNRAVNETLSRTLITSGLTLLVVLAQFFFGGESIHAFAFCLVVGLIIGTYSTVYIASPVLLWASGWGGKKQRTGMASIREQMVGSN